MHDPEGHAKKRDIRTVPVLGSSFDRSCIYRVPEILHKNNERAYTPLLVSIGPYHHGHMNLKGMEDVKSIFMHNRLTRVAEKKLDTSNVGGVISWLTLLENCVDSITEIETDVRRHYSEPINFGSKEFVEMLIVDGLFIIEFLHMYSSKKEVDGLFRIIFWELGILPWDLLLLENQLPMTVLQRLFRLTSVDDMLEEQSLNRILRSYWEKSSMLPIDKNTLLKMDLECVSSTHLLNLVAKMFHPQSSISQVVALPSSHERKKSAEEKTINLHNLIPSATELRCAGVKFQKGSTEVSFLDIKFSRDGVLEIPPIVIDEKFELLLRNLTASEQFSRGNINYITSYIFFMDNLVNSEQDVAFLRKKGIVTIYFGSDGDIADLFNKLCRDTFIGVSYYSHINDRVNDFYKRRPNFWKATLRHDYFNNPWSICSFVATVLLLSLTLTASTFAVLSFTVHNS